MENQIIITIPMEEAIKIASEHCRVLTTEKIPFQKSSGRVLAVDVFSDVDMPPYYKSSMDGYACRRKDLKNELKVLEVIAAGRKPKSGSYNKSGAFSQIGG